MCIKKLLSVLALILAGALLGGYASDIAVDYGFPHSSYVLELQYEPSRKADYNCMQLGALLGENVSSRNIATGEQEDCVLVVTGSLNADGSFSGYKGWSTWYGRWINRSFPIVIPRTSIKSAMEQTG